MQSAIRNNLPKLHISLLSICFKTRKFLVVQNMFLQSKILGMCIYFAGIK